MGKGRRPRPRLPVAMSTSTALDRYLRAAPGTRARSPRRCGWASRTRDRSRTTASSTCPCGPSCASSSATGSPVARPRLHVHVPAEQYDPTQPQGSSAQLEAVFEVHAHVIGQADRSLQWLLNDVHADRRTEQ